MKLTHEAGPLVSMVGDLLDTNEALCYAVYIDEYLAKRWEENTNPQWEAVLQNYRTANSYGGIVSEIDKGANFIGMVLLLRQMLKEREELREKQKENVNNVCSLSGRRPAKAD